MQHAVTEAEQSILDIVNDRMSVSETEVEAVESEEELGKFSEFDFDEQYQSRIAALILRDKTFAKRCAHLVKPDYFDNYHDKLIMNMALRHFDKHTSVLTDKATLQMVLKDSIKRNEIRKEEQADVIARIKELYKTPIDNPDYAAEKVAHFAKSQAIELAMVKVIDLHEKGQFDKIEEVMSEAFKVGQKTTGEVYDYFEERENRIEFREKVQRGEIKRRGLPLGVTQFDNLLHHRGFGYGELTIWMAAAKRGKTTALWDNAKRWSLMGKNVLGITLEVSKNILADRLDANISGVPMNELEKKIKDVDVKVQAAQLRAGKLMIHEYPSNSLRPRDVEELIEDYRSQGVVFDAVVVDYLDIMAPNKWMPNDIANSKSVWLDMRAIAQKYEVVMVSATQTNRDGAGKATADDTDVAEDYNKIRIADLVLSINATEEELAKGESRIYFAASRNQRGKFSVVIKNNMECMQFMNTVLEIH